MYVPDIRVEIKHLEKLIQIKFVEVIVSTLLPVSYFCFFSSHYKHNKAIAFLTQK
jgi:hypothetical protein